MERKYRQLIVWREADDLCVFTYRITSTFPRDERFNIVAQMRRSAQSVPTNIVEGNARRSKAEHKNFLDIALASLEELHYQYHLCSRLQYINEIVLSEAFTRIQKTSYLLTRFRSAIHDGSPVSS